MIKQFNDPNFKKQVQLLRQQHPDERIMSFTYQDNLYWLKQPEKLTGFEKILKAQPLKSFQCELQRLISLTNQGAPVPPLMLWDKDFFVLADAGRNLRGLMNDYRDDEQKSHQLLQQAIAALVQLHQKNIIHGRPALRDMLYKNGQISFVDFESFSKSRNLNWLKARDGLIFIHNLGRIASFSDERLYQIIAEYQQACDPIVWQTMVKFIRQYHWLYLLLTIFKPVARKDLIAIYRLFQQFDKFLATSNSH